MRPITVTAGPLATADDDGVAQNQTPGAAGNLTLNGALVSGGVATFDVPRRVLLTTAADESGKTVTVTGTDRSGQTQTETLTGPNATTGYTVKDFKTVTQVAVSAAFTGNIKVGTNGVGSSRWVSLNYNAGAFEVAVAVKVTGSVVYTVEKTHDNIAGYYSPGVGVVWNSPPTPVVFPDGYLAGAAASGETVIRVPCRAIRIAILSGTGSVEAIITQSGIVG